LTLMKRNFGSRCFPSWHGEKRHAKARSANTLQANCNRSPKTTIRMNGQISAWSLNAQAPSYIQNRELFSINQGSKASAKIEVSSYIERLVILSLQYLELNLPLTAALRAAEADLQDFIGQVDSREAEKHRSQIGIRPMKAGS
jgi:hypothetical protein